MVAFIGEYNVFMVWMFWIIAFYQTNLSVLDLS